MKIIRILVAFSLTSLSGCVTIMSNYKAKSNYQTCLVNNKMEVENKFTVCVEGGRLFDDCARIARNETCGVR